MAVYLAHGVYMCLVDEGAIFLDVSANAYVGIDSATKAALACQLVGLDARHYSHSLGESPEPRDGIAPLIQRGLLTKSKSTGRPFSPLTVSIKSCIPFGTGRSPSLRVGVMHLVTFVNALTYAFIMIRRGDLSAMITRVMALKEKTSSTSSAERRQNMVTLIHIFRRLATLFYTSKNACLLDSVVLTEFLIRHGHQPTLVLGVRTKPFLAHAWVQIEDCVLNDSMEHAQTLVPIAAI